MKAIIDAHIHIDHYESNEIDGIINGDPTIKALIGVSFDLASCKQNLRSLTNILNYNRHLDGIRSKN